MSLFSNTKTKGKSCEEFNIWPKYIVRRAYASFKISNLTIAFGLNGLPAILKIFPLSTPILPLLRTHRRGQAIIIDWRCPISSQIPRFPFVLRTNVYLFWGQMRICLEDKCVLALLQSNPTFRRRFTAIWRMAVTDGIVSAFIPPIRALSQTKKAQTYQGWLFRRNIRISK